MVCFWVNVYVGRHVPSGKVEVGSGVPYTFVPFWRHVVRVHANRSRPTCLWRITWLDTRFLEELSYFCDILAKKWNFSKVRWFFLPCQNKYVGLSFQILGKKLFEGNISPRKAFRLILFGVSSIWLVHRSTFLAKPRDTITWAWHQMRSKFFSCQGNFLHDFWFQKWL